jgi:hypothetical protein
LDFAQPKKPGLWMKKKLLVLDFKFM